MAKTKVDDWSTTAASNADINSISILGTAPVSNFDNAFREAMAQIAATPLAESADDMRDNLSVWGRAESSRVFATVADMVAATGIPDGAGVTLYGYSAVGDMPPASFVYDAASTDTDDGGCVRTAADGGRFIFIGKEIDARLYGVFPSDDGTRYDATKLQAAIDGSLTWRKRLVIPDVPGKDYYSDAVVFIDHATEIAQIDLPRLSKFIRGQVIVSGSPTQYRDGIFAVRKRSGTGAIAGARFTGGNFFFEPSQGPWTYTATGGETVITQACIATQRQDFAVYLTPASTGQKHFLSTASDISAGGSTGFTLSAALAAGDVIDLAIIPASARNAPIYAEGTAAYPVGLLELDGVKADGLPYCMTNFNYVTSVVVNRMRTTGGVDRGGLYFYLSVGGAECSDLVFDASPATGFGAGTRTAYYGINCNDSVTETPDQTIQHLLVSNFKLIGFTAHGVNASGALYSKFSNFEIINVPNFALLSQPLGAIGHNTCLFDNFLIKNDPTIYAGDGATIYVEENLIRISNGVIDGSPRSAVTFTSTSGQKTGNALKNIRVRNHDWKATGARAVDILNQDSFEIDVKVEGAPSGAYGCRLRLCDHAVGQVTVNGLTGMTGGAIEIDSSYRSSLTLNAHGNAGKGVYAYGTSTGGRLTVDASGNAGIGVQTDSTVTDLCIVGTSFGNGGTNKFIGAAATTNIAGFYAP